MRVPAAFQRRSSRREKKCLENQARSRRSRCSSTFTRTGAQKIIQTMRTHFLARDMKSSGTSGTYGTQLFLLHFLFFSSGTCLEQIWNSVMTKKNLREAMPIVTAFIDECREVFGKEQINAAIKAGMDGQQTFWARENGVEVGTRIDRAIETAAIASESI